MLGRRSARRVPVRWRIKAIVPPGPSGLRPGGTSAAVRQQFADVLHPGRTSRRCGGSPTSRWCTRLTSSVSAIPKPGTQPDDRYSLVPSAPAERRCHTARRDRGVMRRRRPRELEGLRGLPVLTARRVTLKSSSSTSAGTDVAAGQVLIEPARLPPTSMLATRSPISVRSAAPRTYELCSRNR